MLEKSAVPFTDPVTKPGTNEKVSLSELSRTGGVLNAFEAVKMADALTTGNKAKTAGNQKSKVNDKSTKPKAKTTSEKTKEKVKSA